MYCYKQFLKYFAELKFCITQWDWLIFSKRIKKYLHAVFKSRHLKTLSFFAHMEPLKLTWLFLITYVIFIVWPGFLESSNDSFKLLWICMIKIVMIMTMNDICFFNSLVFHHVSLQKILFQWVYKFQL